MSARLVLPHHAPLLTQNAVMPGLVPGIHVGPTVRTSGHCFWPPGVDARDKPGHDGAKGLRAVLANFERSHGMREQRP